ncbi:MAG: hypothetical protein ABS81_15420 [Pseudonocardia sp. SCN 72-86]|nr:MAG: hypothetical protein ABS81_15420 [Pseudonocardia sp. SCN 72-86]
MRTPPGTRRLLLVAIAVVLTLGSAAAPADAAPASIYCATSGDTRQPVLLVHGFNSGPSTWGDEGRVRLVGDASAACTTVFDYADRSTRWVTDAAIGPALASRILDLAAASAAAGGSGKVVVVGHSMGGLATRCAASTTCNGGRAGVAERIAELVTLGTPNFGSWLVSDGTHAVASTFSAACYLRPPGSPVTTILCDLVRRLGTSDAGRAFERGSSELGQLPPLPATVPVYALAAHIELRSSFFGLNDTDLGEGGDLVVLPDSALAIGRAIGNLGGTQTIDCGTQYVTDLLFSPRSCTHVTLTNDTRFLDAVAHQIALVAAQKRGPTAQQVVNGVLPAHVCESDSDGWQHSVPITLRNGAGSARNADGSFAGASISDAEVIGSMTLDGTPVAVLQYSCFGSLPENCCAGRQSRATFVAALATDPRGGLRLVGQVIGPGSSAPGDQYGPAARGVRSAAVSSGAVVTTEYVVYPEQYTAAQVGGDPNATVSVRHVFHNGRWAT